MRAFHTSFLRWSARVGRLSVLAAVLALLLLLAACGGETHTVDGTGSSTGELTDTVPTTEETTVPDTSIDTESLGTTETATDPLPATEPETVTETEPETEHTHAFGAWETVRRATCTEDGEECRRCVGCGAEESRNLSANGHTSEKIAAVLPTCTEDGRGASTRCSVCGETLAEGAVLAATGHIPVTDAGREATCTETGLTEGSHCSVCGVTLTEQTEIPMTAHTPDGEASCIREVSCTVCGAHLADRAGHTPAPIEEVAPTCTEAGHTGGSSCSICGETLEQPTDIPPTGHTFGAEATCTEAQVCTVCGEVIQPANGHFPEVVEQGVPATCTEGGIADRIRCKVCGEILQESVVLEAKGHTHEPIPDQAATCSEVGSSGGVRCADCGIILEEPKTIPARGHNRGVYFAPVKPTCTKDGLTLGWKCSTCDYMTQPQEVIPATGHTAVVDKAIAPTCIAIGLTEGSHCEVCNAILVPRIPVLPTGHTFGACAEELPTCTRVGWSAGECCLICGYEKEPRTLIPATGHTPVTDPAVEATATDYGWTEGCHCETCGAILMAQVRLPRLETELYPGNSDDYRGLLIVSVYGTGKNNIDASASHGFIQLYNSTDHDISLAGASLYYQKKSGSAYTELIFPSEAVIPAGGYYLVRAASPTGYVAENAIIDVCYSDLDWDIALDNKEVHLVLASSGWDIYPTEDITDLTDAVSVFVSSEVETYDSVYAVNSLSKKKVAVRTALKDYSGYHIENLTRMATPELERISPRTSDGRVCPVKCSFLEVDFSHTAGIYREDIDLILTAPEGYTIRYTLDGSDPRTSKTAQQYDEAVTLTDSSALAWRKTYSSYYTSFKAGVDAMVGGYVVKAYATDGVNETAVYTNTYFVLPQDAGWGVNVVSISIPVEDMLGSNGFYTHYNELDDEGSRPRGMAVMEVFDPQGDRVGHSNVELAVSGAGSTSFGMRSLRIYYKGSNNQEGGMESDLNYDLFGGLATDKNGQAITSFSRLLLRNSGQDCGFSGFRDAYMQRAAEGLTMDTMASSAALVFINGEFWGVYNFRERYSPEYVSDHTGVNKDSVTIIENANSLYNPNPIFPFADGSGVEGEYETFLHLLEYIETQDLSLPECYAYVEAKLDIDSLLDMCAVRSFFCATDWPENNIKLWRNTDPNDPSGMDTKWHFVLIDTDWGMGLNYNTGVDSELFPSLLFTKECTLTSMINSLMENPEFHDRMIARLWSITDYLNAERLNEILDEMVAERVNVMQLQADRWPKPGATIKFSVEIWNSQVEIMRDFINTREEIYKNTVASYFSMKAEELDALAATWYPTN